LAKIEPQALAALQTTRLDSNPRYGVSRFVENRRSTVPVVGVKLRKLSWLAELTDPVPSA
jgi:hypothetical protein